MCLSNSPQQRHAQACYSDVYPWNAFDRAASAAMHRSRILSLAEVDGFLSAVEDIQGWIIEEIG